MEGSIATADESWAKAEAWCWERVKLSIHECASHGGFDAQLFLDMVTPRIKAALLEAGYRVIHDPARPAFAIISWEHGGPPAAQRSKDEK